MIVRTLPKVQFRFSRAWAEVVCTILIILSGIALLLAVNHLSNQVTNLKTQVTTARTERNAFNSQTRSFQCFDYRQVNGDKTIQVCDGVPSPSALTTTTVPK